MATWKELIEEHLEDHGLTFDDVIVCTLSAEDLVVPFDDGYGGTEGKAFTAWTEKRVLFPVVYDGAEWVDSVPRNPCDEATEHCGG